MRSFGFFLQSVKDFTLALMANVRYAGGLFTPLVFSFASLLPY